MTTVMLVAAATLVVVFSLVWVASVWKRDASIVDVLWGPAFGLVAVSCVVAGPQPPSARAWLVLMLVLGWGGRLGLHLFRRNRGAPEDRRYRAMRAAQGARFWWSSFFSVYLLQASIAWVVSLPLQASIVARAPLGILDVVGAALVVVGVAIESVADAQLARFVRSPGSEGKIMDRGIWAWSRHPNYFGDAVVWWGFGALAAANAPWSLVGPAAMTLLLMRVSGVTLLEKTIGARRPGYAEYASRTSAFFPWPPRR